MACRMIPAIALALAAWSAPHASPAQDTSSWAGQKVVTKHKTPLRGDARVADDDGSIRVYKVDRVDGDRLWLSARGVSGWVPPGEVVPFDRALDFFTAEIKANRGTADAYVRRAFVRAMRDEHDLAIADLDQAIRLEPTNARAYNGRGNSWNRKKEYDKALADYTEALRLDPKFVIAYSNRGTVWRAKEDYARAVADYGEAIRLDPNHVSAYVNRGNALKKMGMHRFAIANYTEAIRLEPKDVAAHVSRGNAEIDLGMSAEAAADYGEAIRLDPKSAEAYNGRGLASEAQGRFDDAIAAYNQSIRLDPNSSRPFSNRARLWATCPVETFRDGKKAVESATRACELTGWKEAEPLNSLAAAYAETGDFPKAIEWQEKANQLVNSPQAVKKGEERLKLYGEKKPYRESFSK